MEVQYLHAQRILLLTMGPFSQEFRIALFSICCVCNKANEIGTED